MHQPVLLKEVVEHLQIKKEGRYVDGTLGVGGHAEAILQKLGPQGRLLGLDVDPNNLRLAKDRLQPFEDQTITRRVNFRGLQGVLRDIGWTEVDGLIFDLGISSSQLDSPDRGFSFQKTAPLDMRLDPSLPETALDVLKKTPEDELAQIFKSFGVTRKPHRISRYLRHDVDSGRIENTQQLASFCERVMGRRGKIHPATKIFLALRCMVNQELEALKNLLEFIPQVMKVEGRLTLISFHSLEDREVKFRFRDLAKEGLLNKTFRLVNKKPIVPSLGEIKENPRSRSAKLRVLERTT